MKASNRTLLAQFHPLEDALVAMGVTVWPMVELEADDALASAAYLAEQDASVEKVCIWTPDKDLAQCVRDDRVVQVDRRSGKIRNAAGVREKFGVEPRFIPDYLALVGDAADGYPGIASIGPATAARMINRYGPIEAFRFGRPRRRKEGAGAALQDNSRRSGPTPHYFPTSMSSDGADQRAEFPAFAARIGEPRLVERCEKARLALASSA